MTLVKIGDKGEQVRIWENFLFGRGFFQGVVDGVFTNETKTATAKFQKEYGLIDDGIVGPRTLSLAKAMGCPDLTVSESKSSRIEPLNNIEREKLFGKFSFIPAPTSANPEAITITDKWPESNIISVAVPQLRDLKGVPASLKVPVNKFISEQFLSMWEEWEKLGLLDLVLTFNGTWVPRYIRGSRSILSNHSWGTAFDINVPFNPLGSKPAPRGVKGSVVDLVPIAEKYGFYWGGNFTKRPDGMHFEACKLI
ncbi:MAG: hypothetical protein EBR67_10320 [Proteobacteria bacterium]|nr:hypothetical protein [Pseudomonadota bacterium]